MVASTCVDFYFSHDKAARELGYQPVVSFEQAQAETLTWLKENNEWLRAYAEDAKIEIIYDGAEETR